MVCWFSTFPYPLVCGYDDDDEETTIMRFLQKYRGYGVSRYQQSVYTMFGHCPMGGKWTPNGTPNLLFSPPKPHF
jgi:hypothetical protein